MEQTAGPEQGENDSIHLSRISENNQASHLLKLLISTSLVGQLKDLFLVVMTELKDVLEFASADLVLFASVHPDNYDQLTYTNGRIIVQKNEYDPSHLSCIADLKLPQQTHRSKWLGLLPSDCSLFIKETAFEYGYSIPIRDEQNMLGILTFRTNNKGGFNARHFAVLHISGKILTPKFVDLIKRSGAMPGLDKPTQENETTIEDPGSPQKKDQLFMTCGDLITVSEKMKSIFSLISELAYTQSSVLILGETGTGKELIAKALHHASPRKNKPLVKINCAALPANIIESELFGHEKGSFTDATEQRIGKFEQAHNGTIFLDEIGELPIDLQAKLLRAIQEKEIERIGGKTVKKINVRIVAATNRDLQKEVRLGNFRSDLYFRLNVFPILIPPLRERKEDIPLLAMHFLKKYTKKGTRQAPAFSAKVIKQLKAYDWPGNVRELENFIQRFALLADGILIKELPAPIVQFGEAGQLQPPFQTKTIDEVEREHIISVLQKSKGKVAGIGGAAEILKLPSSTLVSKMKRLKIKFAYSGNTQSTP